MCASRDAPDKADPITARGFTGLHGSVPSASTNYLVGRRRPTHGRSYDRRLHDQRKLDNRRTPGQTYNEAQGAPKGFVVLPVGCDAVPQGVVYATSGRGERIYSTSRQSLQIHITLHPSTLTEALLTEQGHRPARVCR
jgi:hypothetical protein